MRKQPLVLNEYYHIYNRGVDKRDIFIDNTDIKRFIESILEFNQIDKVVSLANLRKNKSEIGAKSLSKDRKPLVAIVAYCLNPNHFHFVLKQLADGGISKFMLKIQSGYTSYFNVKNQRSGSLFQGTFKAHHIGNENYFNKMLGYVNNNYEVHDIPESKKDLIFASDYEYKNNNFKIVKKEEAERILEIFGGNKNFEKHCNEIVHVIRQQRGKTSLLEEDNLPDRD